ncbi:MAG: isocitrate lyase/phosphoenolpyruvate mutase family protein [Polyangiales bacterium]
MPVTTSGDRHSKLTKAQKLRARLALPGPLLVAGAHHGLSGVLVEQAGFDAVWASGFEISASFATPDANILTMGENVAVAEAIDRVTGIPVIADCDNGFGNAVNVIRTVQAYERAGIAAICMEDNIFPKRCSFYAGVKRELESAEEFAGKIRAAKDGQRSEAFGVIARTEALIAGWGMEEALMRGRKYAEAGADLVLIHSKSKSPDEVLGFAKAWKEFNTGVPLVCVPTIYKETTAEQLHEAGFKVVIYANHALRASIKAMRTVLGNIAKAHKASVADPDIVSLEQVYELVGVNEMKLQEEAFLPAGGERANAIVLAAGSGKAVGPIGAEIPKAMLDLKGKTILERQVATLNAVNIKDIAVVRGFQAAKINLPNLRYYENAEYETTGEAASLLKAHAELVPTKKKDESESRRTLVLYGDVLFDRALVEKLLTADAEVAILVDRTLEAERAQLEGRPRLDLVQLSGATASGPRALSSEDLSSVRRIGQQLPLAEAHAEFVGVMMVTESGARKLVDTFQRALETGKKLHEASEAKRASLTDLIQALVDSGVDVKAVETFKGWMEVDTFEDYQRAWAAVKG